MDILSTHVLPEKVSESTELGAESLLLDLEAAMEAVISSRVGVDTRRMLEGVADLWRPLMWAGLLLFEPRFNGLLSFTCKRSIST